MKKILLGILLGLIAGIADVIPMILQGLSWDANMSAFSMWIIIGFLTAATDLKIKGAPKGVAMSFMVLLPSAVLIAWQQPMSLIPIAAMTLILGSVLGYLIEKFGK